MEEQKTNTQNTSEEAEMAGNNNEQKVEVLKLVNKFLNLRVFNCLLAALIIILAVSYLTVSNRLISRGFSLNENRINLENLAKQNRELELEAMNLESYELVNEKILALEMIKAGEIEYLEEKLEGVAIR